MHFVNRLTGLTYEVREPTEQDAPTVHATLRELLDDEDSFVLVNYLGEVRDVQEIGKILKDSNSSQRLWYLTFINNELVGGASLFVAPFFPFKVQTHEGRLAYWVRRKFRGMGLTYVMLYVLLSNSGVTYVSAFVDRLNIKSMRILEALGLERLALLEEAIYNVKECKLHDVYLYRGKREVALMRLREKLEERGFSY